MRKSVFGRLSRRPTGENDAAIGLGDHRLSPGGRAEILALSPEPVEYSDPRGFRCLAGGRLGCRAAGAWLAALSLHKARAMWPRSLRRSHSIRTPAARSIPTRGATDESPARAFLLPIAGGGLPPAASGSCVLGGKPRVGARDRRTRATGDRLACALDGGVRGGHRACLAANPGRPAQAQGQGRGHGVPVAGRRRGLRHPAVRGAAVHHRPQHGRGRLRGTGVHRRRELSAVPRRARAHPAVRGRPVAGRTCWRSSPSSIPSACSL